MDEPTKTLIAPTCGTCRFSRPDETSAGLSTCRRNAPRPGRRSGKITNWPVVFTTDTCGEYRPRNPKKEN
jgi:hypothetical protein